MNKLFFPICAILLLATSCKSSKPVFTLQPSSVVEQAEDVVAPSNESKKALNYYSANKTQCLPTDFDVTKTIADLKVLPNKIEYSCAFNGNNDPETRKAAVEYAINQALKLNGNADILIEPKHEVKTENGNIISVKVSGYAAYYYNFRTATSEDLKMLKEGKNNTIAPKQDSSDDSK